MSTVIAALIRMALMMWFEELHPSEARKLRKYQTAYRAARR